VFGPALAAVTLGIFGHGAFTKRIGRNEGFNHAGNAFAAATAGALAYLWGPRVVFYLLAFMAIASSVSVLAIPKRSIDHNHARGLDDAKSHDATATADDRPSGLTVLLTCRPLLVFAGCAIMFHFANAAMLPLVGQKLALQDKNLGTSLMSACIVAAQIVMVPMAMLVGAKADAWGRKPLFLVALSVLTIRGCLYPLSDNPYWLVGVQLLDGVGAGIYGAVSCGAPVVLTLRKVRSSPRKASVRRYRPRSLESWLSRQAMARRSLRFPVSPSLGLGFMPLSCPKRGAKCRPKPKLSEAKPRSLPSRACRLDTSVLCHNRHMHRSKTAASSMVGTFVR
jgi:Major Facilitator Superfamily